jgi:hypothetical protein
MKHHLVRVLSSLPYFIFFGLATIALFLVVGVSGTGFGDTSLGQSLMPVLRVLIFPLWLMRTLMVMVGGVIFGFGGGSFPIWYDVLTIPVLLLPYLVADFVLAQWRSQTARCRQLRDLR